VASVIERGTLEIIPANIINETPLPIPL